MRHQFLLMLVLLCSACAFETGEVTAVDPASLGAKTSREQALIFAADGALQQGNAVAAERDYLAAAELSKGHIDAHLALARLYDQQHQPEKHDAILTKALAFQPNHPLANYLKGKRALDTHRYEEALAAFNNGLTQRPDDIDLNLGKAIAQDMQGEHAAAQMVYLRTMRVNPNADLGFAKSNLAMSYLLSDAPKKAVELLRPEVKKPNVSSVTRHNLALAYGVLGRHAEAKKLLRGEIDEETRLLAVARLKEYIKERSSDMGSADLVPSITRPATDTAPKTPRFTPAAVKKPDTI